MDNFTLDKCSYCGQYKALKNGVCAECRNKVDVPDFMKDLFGKFTTNKEHEN
jgi:ribosomal protein L32